MARLDQIAAGHLDHDRVHARSVDLSERPSGIDERDIPCERSRFFVCSAIIDRSTLSDYEADDVLVVRDPEQLRALGGEVRARMVMLLRERAASASELAETLGIAKGTAAHHVKVLERAGLVRVVATRRVRAVTEKYYGRVARLYVLKTDDADEGMVGEGALAAVLLRQAAEEILPSEAPARSITAGLSHVRLTPEDARRLGIRLNRLFAAIQEADRPEGEPWALAAALYPAPSALPSNPRKKGDDA